MTKSVPKRRREARRARNLPRKRWQLQTAKAHFSELFRRARAEGPQWVTRQDKDAVVVLPAEEFERLQARSRQPASLVDFFAESPLARVKINFKRKRDYGRTVKL